jgi:hypothetical protein
MKYQEVTEFELTEEEVLTACKFWIDNRCAKQGILSKPTVSYGSSDLPPSVIIRVESPEKEI